MNKLYEYYDVTGGADVITSSVPSTFYYDPSTFYNYNQDNLSISSLDSRFKYLSENVGFPARTSLSGVTLLVSATAVPNASAGIYSSVQQAINALPRTITYPVNIQVAGYRGLGSINIENITCEGSGAIQIHTLNYGSDTQASAALLVQDTTYNSTYLSTVYSPSVSSQISSVIPYRVNTNIYDATLWASSIRGIAQVSPDSQKETSLISFASNFVLSGLYGGFLNSTTTPHSYVVGSYVSVTNGLQIFYDRSITSVVSSINPLNASSLANYRRTPQVNDIATCVLYGAYFSSINIKNSNKIKLKGVLVDGGFDYYDAGASSLVLTHSSTVGLTIENSNVLLEDVSIIRCSDTGIRATNSKISVAKSFAVSRIYQKSDANFVGSNAVRGTGVDLINSILVFDTDSTNAYCGRHIRMISEGCEVGLRATNSLVTGGTRDQIVGQSYLRNAGSLDTRTAHLQSTRNKIGFQFINSVLDFEGRLGAFLNLTGLHLVNSEASLPQFSIDDNQNVGIYLDKSILSYGKNAESIYGLGGISGNANNAEFFHCDFNGVNLKAINNSTVKVHDDAISYTRLGYWGGNTPLSAGETNVSSNSLMRNFGLAVSGTTDLSIVAPSMIISNSSNAYIVGMGYIGDVGEYSRKGACAAVTKNSTLTLQGFGDRWTVATSNSTSALSASNNFQRMWTSAAFLAKDNSRINFYGPTKVSRYGVDALCEDSSQLYFGPPKDVEFIDARGKKYGLDSSANHTKVELHSLRSCLVANNESKIKMYGLGVSADSNISTQQQFNSLKFYSQTSGGHVAFLPNMFSDKYQDATFSSVSSVYNQLDGTDINKFTRASGLISDYEIYHSQGSTGGMCVRAVDNSTVDINLVNFKFGMPASSVAGAYYNLDGKDKEDQLGCASSYVRSSMTTFASALAQHCWSSISSVVSGCTECPCGDTTTTTTTQPGGITTSYFSTITLTTLDQVNINQIGINFEIPTTMASSLVTTVSEWTYEQPINEVLNPNFIFGSPPSGGSFDDNTIASSMRNWGSQINIWNICDTSKLKVSNVKINSIDPYTACINNDWHGPAGQWWTGAPLDYYGRYGFAAGTVWPGDLYNQDVDLRFKNQGIFRIMVGGDGDLKTLKPAKYVNYELSSTTLSSFGGLFSSTSSFAVDQIIAQGYPLWTDYAYTASDLTYATRINEYKLSGINTNISSVVPVFGYGLPSQAIISDPLSATVSTTLPKLNGAWLGAIMNEAQLAQYIAGNLTAGGIGTAYRLAKTTKFGLGDLHPAFYIPPIRMKWNGYNDIMLDETAASLFANARHAAIPQVGLVSIYKSETGAKGGGEGRAGTETNLTFGNGVRSLNIFDLNELV